MIVRTDQTEFVGEIVIVSCWCGIRCGLPIELDRFRRRRHDEGQDFAVYCPLGHQFVPAGKSDAQRLREQLSTARESESWWRDRAAAARREAEHERRSAIAYKGHLTRMRHRVARGVCPAGGCKRSFSDLHDHVATCHPELLGVLDEAES